MNQFFRVGLSVFFAVALTVTVTACGGDDNPSDVGSDVLGDVPLDVADRSSVEQAAPS